MNLSLSGISKSRSSATPTILYAAELGETESHLAAFRRVAIDLNKKGIQIVFAVRNVPEAAAIVGRDGFRILSAPQFPRMIRALGNGTPVSYPEILAKRGFMDEAALSGVVRAWLDLFSITKPSLLVANHSPAALLAARAAGLTHVLFGAPFWAPPRTTPMQTFFPRLKIPGERLAGTEQTVLRLINRVLHAQKAAPLATFSELFGLVRENFLCSLPELDPYPMRTTGRYCDPSLQADEASAIVWPGFPRTRVLVLVSPRHPQAQPLLEQLRELDATVALCPPKGLRWDGTHKNHGFLFCEPSTSLSPETLQSDLAVSHGDLQLVSGLLLAGTPAILLPLNPEQSAITRRVEELERGYSIRVDTERRILTSSGQVFPHYRSLFVQTLSLQTARNTRTIVAPSRTPIGRGHQTLDVSRCLEGLLR